MLNLAYQSFKFIQNSSLHACTYILNVLFMCNIQCNSEKLKLELINPSIIFWNSAFHPSMLFGNRLDILEGHPLQLLIIRSATQGVCAPLSDTLSLSFQKHLVRVDVVF